MRWFSFEDVSEFWIGDYTVTRMLMDFIAGSDLDGEGDLPDIDVAGSSKSDVRQELQMFRQAAGTTPAFTARLLSCTNAVNMRVIMTVCRPSWSAHPERFTETAHSI
jgi:hypothetical protein